MQSWRVEGERGEDAMGPAVTRAGSGRPTSPPLKNGNELRAAGYLVAVGSRTARFRRKHKNKVVLVVLLVLLFIFLCLSVIMSVLYGRLRSRAGKSHVCTSRECLRSAANLALSMDPTADPCDDFNQFVCGKWAVQHPRPDGVRSYDWFRDKQTHVYALVRDALTRNDSDQRPLPVQHARDLYDACMDTDTLDKLGLSPVTQVLDQMGLPRVPALVNSTGDPAESFDWLDAVTRVKTLLGMDVIIGFDIFTDPKNSSVYRLVMGSPETTNPFPSLHNKKRRPTSRRKKDRSGRREDEEQAERLVAAALLKLFAAETNDSTADPDLDDRILRATDQYYTLNNDLYELENDNETDSSDDWFVDIPEYLPHQLQKLSDEAVSGAGGTPQPLWERYLTGVFAVSNVTLDPDADAVLVSAPDLRYLTRAAALIAKTPPLVIQLYIWMKVVQVTAVHTTSEVRMLCARGEREGRGGAGEEPPRGLHCSNVANDMLGMAVAYAIADPHFLNVTKPKIETMIKEMKNALASLVGHARWMDDDTKLASYRKIVEMKSQVGFPDWLLQPGALERHYQGVEVRRDRHLANMVAIIRLKVRRVLNRFREGNRYSWATDPTEVNAYHTFQENTITVPMVMLQYPFFDLGLDSLNYGSLGTIVGHEITHGFDNFGRQFDRNGNFLPWWSNATVAAFLNMTQCFVDQYSTYHIPELDENVDGSKTLGENIADNGGVRAALAALHWHRRRAPPELMLPGFEHYSSDQLFFLSYGNLWCGVSTRESLALDLSDEHAPQHVRARGSLQNSADFARAWHCAPGTAMNPDPRHRCVIY